MRLILNWRRSGKGHVLQVVTLRHRCAVRHIWAGAMVGARAITSA
ncbi:MAG: hypothetical protein ACK4GO_16720 [Gemmobacter sp.]